MTPWNFQSKNTESPKAPVESHHFREDTVDTHLRYPSELSSQSCKGFCEKSCTILQHDFSWRNRWRDAPVTTGRSRLCWHLHRDLGISTFTTSPPAKSHPVGQWQLAIRIPLLPRHLHFASHCHHQSPPFFFRRETRAKADRSPVAQRSLEVFWCVVVPPSKNGRNNEKSPPNQGGRPLKNDLNISPWEFQPPEVWSFARFSAEKTRPWGSFQTDADFLGVRKKAVPP